MRAGLPAVPIADADWKQMLNNNESRIVMAALSRRLLPLLLVALAAGRLCGAGPQAPVIPGLEGSHPLDGAQIGALLVGELRCGACHDGMQGASMKEAPNLTQAGSRLTPEFMARFIADPAAVHPGTTMPGLLGAEPAETRREVAESIAAYLFSLDGEAPPKLPEADANPEAGKGLFHEVGCVACHSPRAENGEETIAEGSRSLAHLPGKYRPGALAAFLHQPLLVRPSGRMPDMKLSREEAASLAAYLDGGAASVPTAEAAAPDPLKVAAGKQAFTRYNCSACHQLGEQDRSPRFPGPALGDLDPARGCLSDAPGAAPDFRLSDFQRQSIRKAIEKPAEERSPAERIKLGLTRLNCIACHVREDFGGVPEHLDGYFHSTEEGLGNESRIPPPLTLIGAKLRPEWMNKVLYDGVNVRPYMKTRMPQFGETPLEGLAELFAEVDHLEAVELPEPDRDSRPMVRNGAHQLLGDKGLNCIACHNYNGKESPGMKGLDLMTTYQRLQPAWFYHFMKNPGGFRPGIVMPSYWPDGKAVQSEILDGDTELQLRALWYNFSLGRSARDPSGLRSRPSNLVVGEQTRTYRGRSNVAGYRGIAVGFPGGMNYAFNAQNGALSAIWEGEFVNVGWQGQGVGNFNPIGRPVQLAQDVAFLQLPDAPAAWPLRPQTSKEQPVNPDPLYPRQHGYAFLGYSLDGESIPTFRYRCGSVRIEDRSVAVREEGANRLHRDLHFSAPETQTIWFRALTGNIESESQNVFETPELRITTSPAKTLLRAGADEEKELLIELPLPKGESSFTIDYEVLR